MFNFKVKSINNVYTCGKLLSCNHLVTIDNHINTRKMTISKMHGIMNAHTQEIISSTSNLMDVSKYNLRCNRNISEKMTKKDFIYNIPTVAQTIRKVPYFIYSLLIHGKFYSLIYSDF